MAGFSFEALEFEGAYLINNFYAGDSRGGFSKFFEKDIFSEAGIKFELNETFVSLSSKNVIRGLHFQLEKPQAKLVSVIQGRIWDVIVDLRPDSKTYKKWKGFELSGENHRALYIPRGFAHGFVSLEDRTFMMYQCDGKYSAVTDTGIRYDDPDINVVWPETDGETIHSERDLKLQSFREYLNDPMRL